MTLRMKAAGASLAAFLVAFVTACLLCLPAYAATSAVYTGTTNPTYENPITGTIEDSAGTSNVSLGETMVTNVTHANALVEQDTEGNVYFTLRFYQADSLSDVQFETDGGGDGNFVATEGTVMQTDAAEETVDYRFQVSSTDSVVRINMYVDPMGRAVTYFVSVSDLVEGNNDSVPFVQTITAGETSEDNADVDASNVSEYNADGEEVTGEESASSESLDGSTIGMIVGVIVVVVVVAGAVSYFAYFKPKRANQAKAAAAAAASAKPKDDEE